MAAAEAGANAPWRKKRRIWPRGTTTTIITITTTTTTTITTTTTGVQVVVGPAPPTGVMGLVTLGAISASITACMIAANSFAVPAFLKTLF